MQEGARLYNKAERMVADERLKNLVQLKKRLELGRYWIGKGNLQKAQDQLLSALQLRTEENVFRPQVEELLRHATHESEATTS